MMPPPDWTRLPIAEHLNDAMATIVAPVPNRKLMTEVPAVIATIQKHYPKMRRDLLACAEAGLWLLADDLETSHRICQDIDTPLGSAWHAVMHRREGDFSNSLYWWRRAGKLSWIDPRDGTDLAMQINRLAAQGKDRIHQRVQQELTAGFDPAALTRIVEYCWTDKTVDTPPVLVQVCRLEWLALFGMSMEGLRAG